MDDAAALRLALDLLHVPWRVRPLRSEPLPPGVLLLLRIVAGDREAEREAARLVDRSAGMVREAATFYVEQILFCSEADSYRVLGASPDATNGELRRNMALLMTWLHPDVTHDERAVFVARVSRAWNDLKTPDRRALYDRERGLLAPPGGRSGKPRRRSRSGNGALLGKGTRPDRPPGRGGVPPGRLRRALARWLQRFR